MRCILEILPLRAMILLRTHKKKRGDSLCREYINNHQRNVSRNMDCEGHSGEISMLLDSREKVILVIQCPENLAELYSSVLWKINLQAMKLDS